MRNVPLHDVNEIQQVFAENDLDAVVILSPRNLWALTGAARAFSRRPGYRRNSCAIAFRDRDPILISGRFQEEPSLIFSWIRDITTYSDYLESPLARAAEVLRAYGLASGLIGIEARAHTTEFFDDLVNGLEDAEFVPCDDALDRIWAAKTPEEIDVLTTNLEKMGAAINVALTECQEGEREETLHKSILAQMRRSGTTNIWGTVVSGDRLHSIRQLPSEQTLDAGKLFRLNYTYAARNYPARLCRMGAIGTATPEQRAEYQRFIQAVKAAIELIGPDQTGKEIFDNISTKLEEAGFESGSTSYGSALGLGIVERPVIQPNETFKTQINMILSIEPSTADGFLVNQMLKITSSGHEVLNPSSLPSSEELLII